MGNAKTEREKRRKLRKRGRLTKDNDYTKWLETKLNGRVEICSCS